MVSYTKCPLCGNTYPSGEPHECDERQKFAKEHAVDVDSGHPDE